jgi:hypothetical protein
MNKPDPAVIAGLILTPIFFAFAFSRKGVMLAAERSVQGRHGKGEKS